MPINPLDLSDFTRYHQAASGVQELVFCVSAPAGAEAVEGKTLNGKTLRVNGDYECLIPIWGLTTALEVHITATLTGATLSTDLDTLYYVADRTDPSSWVEKTAGTGAGSVTTTVRQTATITTIRGEVFARYTLTVGSAGTVAITQCEYNGI